ncbi:hypothetical protein [Gemmobacter serpentinus]|uniref:hypothetical protein n=1 Tax=Gemmobacter serpentinus TaxID=2652247 RepID=UPI00124EAD75|nr:hypothetical protein [Gemmobacter serpentinus]
MSLRATIACPEALIADANQLASCLGLGPDDAQTYGAPVWRDAAGNRYAVASAQVSWNFPTIAASPLTEPPWGADMDAAARAQAVIRIGDPEAPETCRASPAALVAILGDDAWAAIALLDVVREVEASFE